MGRMVTPTSGNSKMAAIETAVEMTGAAATAKYRRRESNSAEQNAYTTVKGTRRAHQRSSVAESSSLGTAKRGATMDMISLENNASAAPKTRAAARSRNNPLRKVFERSSLPLRSAAASAGISERAQLPVRSVAKRLGTRNASVKASIAAVVPKYRATISDLTNETK